MTKTNSVLPSQPNCGGLANEARQCSCGAECQQWREYDHASLKARIQELEGALRKVDEYLDNFGYAKNMKARKMIAAVLQPKDSAK